MLRRTKIVATLGPATDSPESLSAIIAAGVDVTRLNFSHGSAEDHMERARRVRESERPTAVSSPCWPTCRAPNCALPVLPTTKSP